MKIYRDEQNSFEIKIPEEWSLHTEGGTVHSLGNSQTLIFRCRPNEAFNVQISPLTINPFLYQTENEFKQYVQEKGYTSLGVGRINADGEEHVWARFYTGYGQWSKKYRVILHGFEYMITATCLEQRSLLEMEKSWDKVVASFRLIKSDDTTAAKSELTEKKSETPVEPVVGIRDSEPQVWSKDNIGEMKTYRNDELGIEIDVPGKWSPPEKGAYHTQAGFEIIFGCGTNEAFYITINLLTSELSPKQIELKFREYGLDKGYTKLGFGRFVFDNREHVWVQYYMGGNIRVKKYLIFLEETKYEITASFTEYGSDQSTFEQKEKVWDSVVASFHVQKPFDDALRRKHEDGKPTGRIDDYLTTGLVNVGSQNVTVKSMVGMKTYRNEKHGFEIEIPENWSPPPAVAYGIASAMYGPPSPLVNKDVFQYGCDDEAFNFEIGSLFPEPLLDDTEVEFRLYARDRGFTDLRFGRIMVAGKEHVCASYFINDNMGKRWNKKYMIVFGGVEYTITGTCNNPQFFVTREKGWDSIVRTFRVVKPIDDSANFTNKAERYREQRREIIEERIEMRQALGDLYARGYEAVSIGNYKEARVLLEKCLQENPDHVLAHKELAVVLEKSGNIKGALGHRMEVKRLAPDDIVNHSKLDGLLAGSGKRSEALQDVQESLKMMPGHPVLRDLEKKLMQSQFGNYKMTFYSSLICLLLADISFFFPEYIAIKNVWCMSLLMIMPTWGVWVSGPWVGISRKVSGLIAGALYLYFLIQAW